MMVVERPSVFGLPRVCRMLCVGVAVSFALASLVPASGCGPASDDDDSGDDDSGDDDDLAGDDDSASDDDDSAGDD
ncbi:MAG TPA: hypothetical protein DIU15_20170, partial [Deltaproteobacteria bacterium]|nr:hypothetical protein [Deltaproteobacteria bacterium]